MIRRVFLGKAALPLVALSSGAVRRSGETQCRQTPAGVACRSQVNFQKFAQTAYQNQAMSQWCWAACISMVFGYYGRPVGQLRIVSEVYGGVVNMPAGAGIVIAQQLNRPWVDDRGQKFRSTVTAAYDFDAGVMNINNAWMVNELHENRPLVVGAGTHAVVMTAMDYFQTPIGPNPQGVGVFDPWPGRGARALTPAEVVPMHLGGALRFVASVRVQ